VQVTIDPGSGFCFGVSRAIGTAEALLAGGERLYCLGEIVHNDREVGRLAALGLIFITREEFHNLHDCRVLIRAHGEPPETYETARGNNIELFDATCPVVIALQGKVRKGHEGMQQRGGQVVIYGHPEHPEVVALSGQTGHSAIVVHDDDDLAKLDFSRPVRLFSQTTRSVEGFERTAAGIRAAMNAATEGRPPDFRATDTVCRHVSGRAAQLKEFAGKHDVIIFVSGHQSSNGRILAAACREANHRTHAVSSPEELDREWFRGAVSAGICGATSTPRWLMEEVAERVSRITAV